MKDLFKALSDSTRREILDLLQEHGEMTAGEIHDSFDVSKSNISQHLKILSHADLVYSRKVGQYVYYNINVSVFEEIVHWVLKFKEK
ncbi:winged helix-turn-helix transcriptional regulator [Macrococcus equipercicus]|uniref:Winged helix-turn-helix transcriptional regulator n=1 Tax=Macrococcus equipercicus TaxID=69967 RepID=A0ABQ6R9D7_9STAP|nr:autorepressor SdpR family transcription factor [Macrococcus equipercicus]KAA1039885.1 winged helix-turn-helix transcriptional regulator [Macrococcus equipercicus]